jgi:hypothetical protein
MAGLSICELSGAAASKDKIPTQEEVDEQGWLVTIPQFKLVTTMCVPVCPMHAVVQDIRQMRGQLLQPAATHSSRQLSPSAMARRTQHSSTMACTCPILAAMEMERADEEGWQDEEKARCFLL